MFDAHDIEQKKIRTITNDLVELFANFYHDITESCIYKSGEDELYNRVEKYVEAKIINNNWIMSK